GQVATLKELHQAYISHGLASLDPKTAAPGQVAGWAKTTGAYFAGAKGVAAWASSSAAAEELVPLAGLSGQPAWKAGELTTQFRSWAKGHPPTSPGGLPRPPAWNPRAPPEPRSRTGSPPRGTSPPPNPGTKPAAPP